MFHPTTALYPWSDRVVGQETMRASSLGEVAEQLDAAGITTFSVLIDYTDRIELKFVEGENFLACLLVFDLEITGGPLQYRSAAGTWRGIEILAYVGREALSMASHSAGKGRTRAHA